MMDVKDQNMVLVYSLVLHHARTNLKLTTDEYCVADAVYHLQGNPKSKIQGWCTASRKIISDHLGIPERNVYRYVDKLVRLKIIDRDEITKYLRTTEVWYENVVLKRLTFKSTAIMAVKALP